MLSDLRIVSQLINISLSMSSLNSQHTPPKYQSTFRNCQSDRIMWNFLRRSSISVCRISFQEVTRLFRFQHGLPISIWPPGTCRTLLHDLNPPFDRINIVTIYVISSPINSTVKFDRGQYAFHVNLIIFCTLGIVCHGALHGTSIETSISWPT